MGESSGPSVVVRVFGHVGVVIDGNDVPVGGPRPTALLALLAAARGGVVSAERLVDSIWHGEPPPSGSAALHPHVSRLRKVLARGQADPIVRVGSGYRLGAGVRIDAVEVEARLATIVDATEPEHRLRILDGVLEQWTGEPFAGIDEIESIEIERTRLLERRHGVEVERLRVLLELDRLREASAAAVDLESSHPYDESVVATQMIALYRSGRQVEALRTYDRARARLADDLGVDPGPELQRVHQAILGHADHLDGERPTPVLDAHDHLRRRASTPLIGRDDVVEIARRAPGGTLTLITGEGGHGKTRLVEEAVDLADAVVIRGAEQLGDRSEPWNTLFERWSAGPADLDLSGDDLGDVATIVEAWIVSRPDDVSTIVLDDLHALDDLTGLVLRVLIDEQLLGTVRVIATYRASELTASMRRSLGSIAGLPSVTLIRLEPLRGTAAATLAARLTSDDPMSTDELTRFLEVTGGSPLLMQQLARLRRHSVPITDVANEPDLIDAATASIVRSHLEHLETEVVTFLETAAILGARFELSELRALEPSPEISGAETLDRAMQSGLVDTFGIGSIGFSHAIVRSTILARLSSTRRAALHARVAEHLDGRRRSGALVDLDRLGVHLDECLHLVDPKLVFDASVTAADESRRRHEWARSAAHLARAELVLGALGTGPEMSIEFLLDVADAFEQTGDYVASARRFRRVADLAERSGDAATLRRAAVGIAVYGLSPEPLDDTDLRILDQALRDPALAPRDDVVIRSRLVAEGIRSPLPWAVGGHEPTSEAFDVECLVDDARRLDDADAMLWALGPRSTVLYRSERLAEHLDNAHEWLRHARRDDARAAAMMQMLTGQTCFADTDGIAVTERQLTETAALTRRPIPRWYESVWRSTQLLYRGQVDQAEAAANEAVAVGAGLEGDAAVAGYGAFLFVHRWWTGRIDDLISIGLLERAASIGSVGSGRAFALAAVIVGAASGRYDVERCRTEVDAALAPGAGGGLPVTRLDLAMVGEVAAIHNDPGLAHVAIGDAPWGRSPIVASPSGMNRIPESAHLGRMDVLLGEPWRGLARIDAAMGLLDGTGWAAMQLRLRTFRCDAVEALGDQAVAERRRIADDAARLGLHGIASEALGSRPPFASDLQGDPENIGA